KYCHGGCPKHRFSPAAGGTTRLNYLCPSYRMIFAHSAPALARMADRLRTGRPAGGGAGPGSQARR
ncbi:MAG: anaerobic sulfatase maturase, partial [Alphaproteobacteria bacterium]